MQLCGLLAFPLSADLSVPSCVDSIRSAAATAAFDLQSIYNGNQTDGVLGKFPYPPFYWWMSGAAWGAMVEYWHLTGDESYYNVTHEALVSQISETHNYLPPAEKFDEGNDDIAFWAFGAMSAQEHGFRQPPAPFPSWLQICDNVFNDYVSRWYLANDTCGGGLKWQVFPSSEGYTYKNSISNGGFFQLAARLARYTSNQTYYDWAERVWDWSVTTGLINTDTYDVHDGSGEADNCSSLDHTRWSYNVAIYLYGAAVLHNYTGGATQWTNHTDGLLAATSTFLSPFPNATNVLYEQFCELKWNCNTDQLSFKGYLARWLAGTSLMAPHTAGKVATILKASAQGAALACEGEGHDATCGQRWYYGRWDGTQGVGQSMSALEVITALLINGSSPPSIQESEPLGINRAVLGNNPTLSGNSGPNVTRGRRRRRFWLPDLGR